MAPVRLWVIDADHWPRAYIAAELGERGYETTGFESVREAIVRLFRAPSERPAAILVDLHEQMGDEQALVALAKQEIPVVAIADATRATGEGIAGRPWAQVLHRPLTIGAAADAVERVVGKFPGTGPSVPRR
jgi:DNA-binding NtrC family response regulator